MSKRRPTPHRRHPNRAMTIVQILLLVMVLVVILNIRFKLGEGASQFFETLTAPDVDVSQQAKEPALTTPDPLEPDARSGSEPPAETTP